MNGENEFQLPFGIGLEWKWNIIVYDQDTFNLLVDSHIAAACNFLMNSGAFCQVRVLKGGFRYFTKLYPFMRTQKVLYLPREIESEVTYPLEVIPDFLFLSVKRNSETEEALKDLHIFAKVFLYSEETVRVDDAKKMHYAFPLETSKNSDMFNYLNDCCEFLKMNKNRVHRVLIVADKNLSRGPTLAMAYLIKEGNMTLKWYEQL
nr:unnamed protein product [Spirometra erinaceieuropaei]